MSSILYSQVTCSDYSNDFEVFHTSGGGVKSQSLYPDPAYNHDDFDDEAPESRSIQKRLASFDFGDVDKVSSTPEFTLSHLYVSPEEAERRFTRSALGPKNDYVDSYSSFLQKYFDKTDEKRSDYHDEDNDKNSKYKQVPKEVEQIDKEHHYDNAYNDYEYDRIKLLSQKQEEEIKQNPKNCKVVVKGEMTCSTCKDPVSGAHSESCQFSSAPADKKYAYIKQRAYNSKDDEKKKKDDDSEEDDEDKPEEDWEGDEEASNQNEKKVKPSTTPAPRGRGQRRPTPKQQSTHAAHTLPKNQPPQRRQRNPTQRRYSANYKAEESRPQREVIGLDPFLYKNDEKTDRTYERYFSHVFPESKNGKLKRRDDDDDSSAEVEFLPNYDSKKNVEEVLAEFKTKDWSQCKKEMKGDLTCYQCEDKFGVKHEECMFVSGSAPTRLAYSETKEYHDPEGVTKKDNKSAGSELVSKTSFVPDTNKAEKINRKLIVRKRKAKLQDAGAKSTRSTATTTEPAPKPEDSVDKKDVVAKRTIKRMVSYHYEDHSHPAQDLVYEHNLSRIL